MEQVLLSEELRRVVASFEHWEQLWSKKQPPSDLPVSVQRGFRSYALKKASIFRTLGKEARVRFNAHQGEGPGSASTPRVAESLPEVGTLVKETVAEVIDMDGMY